MSAPTGIGIQRGDSVRLPRLVLGVLLFLSTFLPPFPSLFQPILTHVYTYFYQSSFYRFSGFETIETIFRYAFIEILFTYKFGKSPHRRIDIRGPREKIFVEATADQSGNSVTPKPRVPKMKRPSKRMGEMFIYTAPLLLMGFTMIKNFASVPINDQGVRQLRSIAFI